MKDGLIAVDKDEIKSRGVKRVELLLWRRTFIIEGDPFNVCWVRPLYSPTTTCFPVSLELLDKDSNVIKTIQESK